MAKIGFIGLGIMGKSMAGNLIKGRHTLFLQTRSGEPDDFIAQGGIVCATPREVAQRTDIIMLPNKSDAKKVLFDEDGVVKGLKGVASNSGAQKIIVDMSTISPLEIQNSQPG